MDLKNFYCVRRITSLAGDIVEFLQLISSGSYTYNGDFSILIGGISCLSSLILYLRCDNLSLLGTSVYAVLSACFKYCCSYSVSVSSESEPPFSGTTSNSFLSCLYTPYAPDTVDEVSLPESQLRSSSATSKIPR